MLKCLLTYLCQFRDEYVSEGFGGGQLAARLLRLEVIDYLQQNSLLHPASTTILYVYTNLKNMAKLYAQASGPPQYTDFLKFFEGFNVELPNRRSVLRHLNTRDVDESQHLRGSLHYVLTCES